jgi:hypothetical protein
MCDNETLRPLIGTSKSIIGISEAYINPKLFACRNIVNCEDTPWPKLNQFRIASFFIAYALLLVNYNVANAVGPVAENLVSPNKVEEQRAQEMPIYLCW